MGKSTLWKRAAALSLAAALALPSWASAMYTDTEGHWAEAAIERWSGQYGILGGYEDGSFRPDNTITRGAFAGILNRFLRYTKEADPSVFIDIAGEYWEHDILKLNAAGVYLGNEGRSLPQQNISRQQAVTMIGRAFGLKETAEGELPWADADIIEEYAKGYLLTMWSRGWITDVGPDALFRPGAAITRAEVVNLLNNMVAELFQDSLVYDGHDVAGSALVSAVDGAVLSNMTIAGDLIVAPGVTGEVILRDVELEGTVVNLSGTWVESFTSQPEAPTSPHTYPWVEPVGYLLDGDSKLPIYEGVETNSLTAADFFWDEDGRLQCTNENFKTRFGIDVSAYQNRRCPDETIDWEAVADDGVDFVMVRAALRGYTTGELHDDAYYAQNIDGAMDAGIRTGVYIFSQAITVEEAIEEADFVIDLLRGHDIDGPVAYDWEMGTSAYRVYGIEPSVATACALAFCQRIEEAGYQPLVYMSRYVCYNKFNLPQLTDYPIWYPEYKYPTTAPEKVKPGIYYQMDYWQYTDKAQVAGITGDVDANLQLIRR